MTDEYKGIKIGVEVKLGERLPGDDDLAVTLLLLLELKSKHPKAFKAAMLAIAEMDKPVTATYMGKPL